MVAALAASAAGLGAQPALGLGDIQVLSPTISVRAWTVENGLPQSAVTVLSRDSSGFVWGGTFGGLFRFDGRTIRRFTSSDIPALSGNSVTALTTELSGTLLVGTPGGTLMRLKDGRFVDTIPVAPSAPNAVTLHGILADRPGELWIRRAEWVQRRKNGQWERPLSLRGATSLVRAPSGNVYYAGPQGIVRVAPDGCAAVVSPKPTPELGQEYGIHLDARNRLWVGSTDGLWIFEEGAPARRVSGVAGTVNAIITDSVGTVWFGADEKLYRLTGAALAANNPPELLADVRARLVSIARTNDGLLVLGTLEGLLLVRPNAIRVVESRRAIPKVETGSLASPGDGTVWLSSSCSDVLRMGRDTRVIDSVARPNPAGCTRSLTHDDRGRLWVGGDGAIRRRNADRTEKVWQIDTLGPGLALVRPVLWAGDSLLFGVSDGRVGVVGADDRVRFLPAWQRRTDQPVHSMTRAPDGTLWIAQSGRVSRVARGIQRFGDADGIPGPVPRALYADSSGGLWIGTYGAGLWYFRPGAPARAVPVADQTVSAIIEGPAERLWMPGNRGLSVISLPSLRRWVADSTTPPDVRLLSFEEGVPEGNIGSPAATTLSPGILAFSSVTGLVVAHTWGVATGGVTPPVVIDGVRSLGASLTEVDGTYRVGPDQRALYVSMSMPSFRFGDVAQFRYRLREGDPWLMLGNTREVRLAVNAPGRYALAIEGRVPGGEWVGAAPVRLDVQPLLSERLWPRVLVGLLLVGLVVAVVRQRERATVATILAREVELKARRDAAELAERHQREMAQVGRVAVAGELTASLSHELGQPLAAIVNNAEVARRLLQRNARGGEPANAAVEQALLDVVAQGRRASQVVREFRRFLRREHGERELVRLPELLDDVTLLLRQEYAHCGVRLNVHIAPGTPALYVERVLVQQVLVNLLQNSCEASRRAGGGEVLVRARPVDDGARLSVVDNGPGFPPEIRRSAFEPFVTTRPDGMGMGLAIARRVVESHGGHIAIGRLPGAGAVVSLWLPARHIPADASDSLVPSQVTTHA